MISPVDIGTCGDEFLHILQNLCLRFPILLFGFRVSNDQRQKRRPPEWAN